jgi:hypothetical protein
MPDAIHGHDRAARDAAGGSRSRPVLLVTLECDFDAEAERVAVASAVETGADLYLIDLIDVAGAPMSTIFGSRCSLASAEERAAVRRTAATATSLGVHVELLHARTPRPARALEELVGELRPGLLVLGPGRLPKGRRGRRVVEAARAQTSCLVWIVEPS